MFSKVLLTFAVLTIIVHTREVPKNARDNDKLFLQVRPEPNPYPFITRMATDRLNLTCKMFNRTDNYPVNAYNLTWRVPKESMNSSGIVPYRFNDGTIGLRFLDLNESDSGDYTCQAISIGLRFTVKLNIKPHINKGSTGKSYCGSAMFVCSKSVLISSEGFSNNQTINNVSNEFHSPCISEAFVCDGRADCPNQEDEARDICGQNACAGKLRCNDNRCIPESWCNEKIPHDCCRNKKGLDHMIYEEGILSDVKSTMGNVIAKSNNGYDNRYRFAADYGDHVFEGSYLRARDSKSGVDFLHITIYTIIACAIALTIIVLVLVTMLCKTYISNRRHFEQDNYQPNNYRYSTYQDMNRFRQPTYRSANYEYPGVDNQRIFSASRVENEQLRENCSIRNLITRWLGLIRGNDAAVEHDDEEMSRRVNLMNEGSTVNTRYSGRSNQASSFNFRTNARQLTPTAYSAVSQYDETLPTPPFRCPRIRDIYHVDNSNASTNNGERDVQANENNQDVNIVSSPNLWNRICTAFRLRSSAPESRNNELNDVEASGECFEEVNLNDLSESNAPAYSTIENSTNQGFIPNETFGQTLWAPDIGELNSNINERVDEFAITTRPSLWSRFCSTLGLGSAQTTTDQNLNVAATPVHSENVYEQGDINLNFNEILSSDEDFLNRLEDISRNVMMVSPPPYTELMLNEPPVGPPPPYASRDNLADFTTNNNPLNKIVEQNQENLGANEGFVVGNNNLENENGNVMPSTSASPETTDRNNHKNISSKNNLIKSTDKELLTDSNLLSTINVLSKNDKENVKVDSSSCSTEDLNANTFLKCSSSTENDSHANGKSDDSSIIINKNDSLDNLDNIDPISKLSMILNKSTESQFKVDNHLYGKKLIFDDNHSKFMDTSDNDINLMSDMSDKNLAKYKFLCGCSDVDFCDSSRYNENCTNSKYCNSTKGTLSYNSLVPDSSNNNMYLCGSSSLNNDKNIFDNTYSKYDKDAESAKDVHDNVTNSYDHKNYDNSPCIDSHDVVGNSSTNDVDPIPCTSKESDNCCTNPNNFDDEVICQISSTVCDSIINDTNMNSNVIDVHDTNLNISHTILDATKIDLIHCTDNSENKSELANNSNYTILSVASTNIEDNTNYSLDSNSNIDQSVLSSNYNNSNRSTSTLCDSSNICDEQINRSKDNINFVSTDLSENMNAVKEEDDTIADNINVLKENSVSESNVENLNMQRSKCESCLEEKYKD